MVWLRIFKSSLGLGVAAVPEMSVQSIIASLSEFAATFFSLFRLEFISASPQSRYACLKINN